MLLVTVLLFVSIILVSFRAFAYHDITKYAVKYLRFYMFI